MVLCELSVTPLDKGESVSTYVARSVDVIDKSGLDYQVGPMGTVIEGELGQVLAVVQQCIEALAVDCRRVTCSVKLDYRVGAAGRLRGKVDSVENKLGRKVKRA